MDADEFQTRALLTLKDIRDLNGKDSRIVYFVLAINGEAGELAEAVKKAWRDGKSIPVEHIVEELGDILWYTAVLAHELGFSLSQIMKNNLEKLRKRYSLE